MKTAGLQLAITGQNDEVAPGAAVPLVEQAWHRFHSLPPTNVELELTAVMERPCQELDLLREKQSFGRRQVEGRVASVVTEDEDVAAA